MCKEESLNKNCIVVNVSLAMILGLSETIIIEQMNYWLKKSTHIIEGRPWIYNTYAAWQKQLPFFCERTIRRTINKLEIMGIILSGNFNKSKMDKTKWYSLNYDILDKLMRSNLPVDEDISTKAIPETTTETNSKEVVVDINTSEEVFKKILNFYNSNLHMITPHEYEKLKLLYEDIKNPDLIIKAMEISVENRARSFRYIESILYNWMELNLHSLREVEDYIKNYESTHKMMDGKDDNHGEKKYSGARQYSSYNKKDQGESQGKYAGFKPEEPELPEFTEDDFSEFF